MITYLLRRFRSNDRRQDNQVDRSETIARAESELSQIQTSKAILRSKLEETGFPVGDAIMGRRERYQERRQ